MRLPPFPGGGGPGWAEWSRGLIALFTQKLTRPFWLFTSPTADLPTLPEMGANEGAIAYDTDADAPTWYNGSAWKIAFSTSGGTLTGSITVSASAGGNPLIDAADTGAIGASSGGLIRSRSVKPTAAENRVGAMLFGALDSGAAIQNSAAVVARATENWGTLAGEGTRLDLEATANGAFARTVVASVLPTGIEPAADNTFYLGRNDDDSPKAWKGLILHDQTNGKTYRIEMLAGVLTATDLTD